jgi:hypothetical protein
MNVRAGEAGNLALQHDGAQRHTHRAPRCPEGATGKDELACPSACPSLGAKRTRHDWIVTTGSDRRHLRANKAVTPNILLNQGIGRRSLHRFKPRTAVRIAIVTTAKIATPIKSGRLA